VLRRKTGRASAAREPRRFARLHEYLEAPLTDGLLRCRMLSPASSVDGHANMSTWRFPATAFQNGQKWACPFSFCKGSPQGTDWPTAGAGQTAWKNWRRLETKQKRGSKEEANVLGVERIMVRMPARNFVVSSDGGLRSSIPPCSPPVYRTTIDFQVDDESRRCLSAEAALRYTYPRILSIPCSGSPPSASSVPTAW
jgi:hypothetical protein